MVPGEGCVIHTADCDVLDRHQDSMADWVDVRWRLSVETLIALARRQWPPSCVNRSVQPAQELQRNSLG